MVYSDKAGILRSLPKIIYETPSPPARENGKLHERSGKLANIPLSKAVVPFPRKELEKSRLFKKGLENNPSISFVLYLQNEAAQFSTNAQKALAQAMRLKEACGSTNIDWSLLRPLSHDFNFMRNMMEDDANDSGALTNIEKNSENEIKPETHSDTTQHKNTDQARSDVTHIEETDGARKFVKRTKSMVEIFNWMEKSKFKPKNTQQSVIMDEYFLGFGKPDTPLNLKGEEYNETFRDLNSLKEKLFINWERTLLDKDRFEHFVPQTPNKSFLSSYNQHRQEENRKVENGKTVISFDGQSPGKRWRTEFDDQNKKSQGSLKDTLLKRKKDRLHACNDMKTLLPVIELIQQDAEKNFYRGTKRAQPSWNGMLPSIWVEDVNKVLADNRRKATLLQVDNSPKRSTKRAKDPLSFSFDFIK